MSVMKAHLQALGQSEMDDKAHACMVNAHAKGDGGHHHLCQYVAMGFEVLQSRRCHVVGQGPPAAGRSATNSGWQCVAWASCPHDSGDT